MFPLRTELLFRTYILHISLNHFVYIFGGYSKNCCFESFGKFPEKLFQQSSVLAIQAVQCTTYNYTENGIHRKGFLRVVCELSRMLGSTCVGSFFNKVTKEISGFYNSVEYSVMQIVLFQKVALLEIPGNSLLTGVGNFLKIF